jgi:hypothetical protein
MITPDTEVRAAAAGSSGRRRLPVAGTEPSWRVTVTVAAGPGRAAMPAAPPGPGQVALAVRLVGRRLRVGLG